MVCERSGGEKEREGKGRKTGVWKNGSKGGDREEEKRAKSGRGIGVGSGLKFGRNVLAAQTDAAGWSKSNWVVECRGWKKKGKKNKIHREKCLKDGRANL